MEVQALLDATPAGLAAAKLLFPVDDNDKAAAAGDQRAAPHHVDDTAESLPPPQQAADAPNASSWASLRGLAATSFGSAKEGLTSLGSAALTAAGQLGDVVKEQMGGASKYYGGQQKGAKIPTSKGPISVVFHSFRLIFRRAIISVSDLDHGRLSLERARAEQPT